MIDLTSIPNALHCCPGCMEPTSGEEYCTRCRVRLELYEARFHARRASALFASLPREEGLLPETARPSVLRFVKAYGVLAAYLATWAWLLWQPIAFLWRVM